MEAPGMRLMARFTVRAQPSQCSTTLRTTVRNSTIVVISVTQSTKEMVIKKQKPPSSQKPFIRLQLSLSEPLFSKSLLLLWMSWWFLVSQWADTCWERGHQEDFIDTILCVWIKKKFAFLNVILELIRSNKNSKKRVTLETPWLSVEELRL